MQLADAKERANDLYIDYRMRQKNGLPVVSKRFDRQIVCATGIQSRGLRLSHADKANLVPKTLTTDSGSRFETKKRIAGFTSHNL